MMSSMGILYVMNGDLNNMKIFGQVINFAKQNLADLTLLDVIDSLPRSSRMLITSVPTADLRDSIVHERLDQLEALVSRIGSGSGDLRSRVLFGNHAKEIAHEAAEGGYDLVIKSAEKGPTDKYLLRKCSCPVWLLEPDDYDVYGQIAATHCPQLSMQGKKATSDAAFPPETTVPCQ